MCQSMVASTRIPHSRRAEPARERYSFGESEEEMDSPAGPYPLLSPPVGGRKAANAEWILISIDQVNLQDVLMTNTDEMECQCSMIYSPAHVQVDYEAVSVLIHNAPTHSVANEGLKRTIHVVGLTDHGIDKHFRGPTQGEICSFPAVHFPLPIKPAR